MSSENERKKLLLAIDNDLYAKVEAVAETNYKNITETINWAINRIMYLENINNEGEIIQKERTNKVLEVLKTGGPFWNEYAVNRDELLFYLEFEYLDCDVDGFLLDIILRDLGYSEARGTYNINGQECKMLIKKKISRQKLESLFEA